MITKTSEVATPHGNTVLWRYMNLEKFYDLLTSSELYFINVSQLTDQYEGTIPKKNYYHYRRSLLENGESMDDALFKLERLKQTVDKYRTQTLVNCWTIDTKESYALWKIYLSGARGGVAIRTTSSRLQAALNKGGDSFDETVYFGIVKYTDFIEDVNSRFQWVTRKSIFYDYEKEARLFILHEEAGAQPPYNIIGGRRYKVDISILIDKIYISPFSHDWFSTSFKKIIERLNPELLDQIIHSEILDK